MKPRRQHHHRLRHQTCVCEPLEGRRLCSRSISVDFDQKFGSRDFQNGFIAITPPGGGGGAVHEARHLHPVQGLTGLRQAEANSGGPNGPVVDWQPT